MKAQQTFENKSKHPISVTFEPVCNYCLLQPGDWLTLIYGVPNTGDALKLIFYGPDCLWIYPDSRLEYEVLVNGLLSEDLSWKFKG